MSSIENVRGDVLSVSKRCIEKEVKTETQQIEANKLLL
jgi:hypothetical protein